MIDSDLGLEKSLASAKKRLGPQGSDLSFPLEEELYFKPDTFNRLSAPGPAPQASHTVVSNTEAITGLLAQLSKSESGFDVDSKNVKAVTLDQDELMASQKMPKISHLNVWGEANYSDLSTALYRFATQNRHEGRILDVWGFRLFSFLRRFCEVFCALRESSSLRWGALELANHLEWSEIKGLAAQEEISETMGLRKYISEVTGRRDGQDVEYLTQKQHLELVGSLQECLYKLALSEDLLAKAGFDRLPYSSAELSAWREWVELNQLIAQKSEAGKEDSLSAQSRRAL